MKYQMEHMAMMMMSTGEQMRFLRMSPKERKEMTDQMMEMEHGEMKKEGGEQKMDKKMEDHSGM